MTKLIINADDFGYSKVFNISILDLIEKNLISSTTVLVNWIKKEQDEQIRKLRSLSNSHNISIGLHLEFSGNNYKEEIDNQYDLFKNIFGFKPSHLDVHKPNKSEEENLEVINFCNKNNLPCRNLDFNKKVKTTSKKYLNGTEISIDEISNLIKKLEDNETYEILFHPGTYDKDCKSSLNKERELDVEKIRLINPILNENNIKLISFNDL